MNHDANEHFEKIYMKSQSDFNKDNIKLKNKDYELLHHINKKNKNINGPSTIKLSSLKNDKLKDNIQMKLPEHKEENKEFTIKTIENTSYKRMLQYKKREEINPKIRFTLRPEHISKNETNSINDIFVYDNEPVQPDTFNDNNDESITPGLYDNFDDSIDYDETEVMILARYHRQCNDSSIILSYFCDCFHDEVICKIEKGDIFIGDNLLLVDTSSITEYNANFESTYINPNDLKEVSEKYEKDKIELKKNWK